MGRRQVEFDGIGVRGRRQVVWFSICLFCAVFSPVVSAAQSLSDEAKIFRWLSSLQYSNKNSPSFGAIRTHHTPAAVSPTGIRYFRVSPYFANIATLAALKTQGADGVRFAERWIRWYLKHLIPEAAADGVPFEHFYRQDGSGETTRVDPSKPQLFRFNDATDSAAALFLTVAYRFETAGGSQELLLDPANRKRIEAQGETILKLQQSDGLVWAKADYPAKFLEDNCEVFDGLSSLALLEGRVYGDLEKSNRYQLAAERVRKAIFDELYDPASHRYRVAKSETSFQKSDGKTWYPDLQSQFWLTLFRVEKPNSPRTSERLPALLSAWDREAALAGEKSSEPTAHLHPEMPFALALLGEKSRALQHLSDILRLKLPKSPADTGFDWQFSCADGGWVLMALQELQSTRRQTRFK